MSEQQDFMNDWESPERYEEETDDVICLVCGKGPQPILKSKVNGDRQDPSEVYLLGCGHWTL